MKVLDKLKKYQEETVTATNEKQGVINGLQQKVVDVQKKIDLKQEAYSKNPAENLFRELLSLKQDLVKLKIDVSSANDIIKIPATKVLTTAEIIEEIDAFVEALTLNKLKQGIAEAKQAYLDSIQTFYEALQRIDVLKIAFIEAGIDLPFILKSLEKHKDQYFANDEIKTNPQELEALRLRAASQGPGVYMR